MTENFLIDFRACQQWRDRGIPRYIQALTKQLISDYKHCNYFLLYDRLHPLPLKHLELKNFAEIVYTDELETKFKNKPVHHYFMTWFFLPSQKGTIIDYLLPPFIMSYNPKCYGLTYDFIPILFPDHYLKNKRHKTQYYLSLEVMRMCDHVFAISEATKSDGINLAKIPKENISCIYGSIDEEKWIVANQIDLSCHRPLFNLKQNSFIVYIAGDDWRKNLPRTIEAHSLFLKENSLERKFPFIIACNLSEDAKNQLYAIGKKHGLQKDSDLIVTGYIPDDELIWLLKNARMSIFPSLYEGLGLPIIESYYCNTPVIGSNSSSIQELVFKDAQFDPFSVTSIANKMSEAYKNQELLNISLKFGQDLIKKLTWKNSVKKLCSKIKPTPIIRKSPVKCDLAVFASLPPEQSGVSIFTFKTLVNSHIHCHLITKAENLINFVNLTKNISKLTSCSNKQILFDLDFIEKNKFSFKYKNNLFILGNSHHHKFVLRTIMNSSFGSPENRFIYLHEAMILGLWFEYFDHSLIALKKFLILYYPEKRTFIENCSSISEIANAGCMGIRPLNGKGTFIVNSNYCKNLVTNDLLEEQNIEVLFHPIFKTRTLKVDQTSSPTLKIGHFGILGPSKRINTLIEACSILSKSRDVELILAGFSIRSYFNGKQKVPNFVKCIDSPTEDDLLHAMASVDLAVQLRWPTYGESSGCISQLLNLKKNIIVSEVGSFSDYKNAVKFVPPEITAIELAKIIEEEKGVNRENAINKILDKFSLNAYQLLLSKLFI